ncbi:MAG: hypothetical protein KAS32_04170, partial [Candidatus Peribacteraceae bacterium]|nr:hypothetical protein [Candidatus Peribacteraceae bacterium]
AERAAKEKARLLAVKGGLPYKGKTKEVIEALLDPRPTTFSSGHDLRSFLKRTQRDLQRSTNPDSTLAKTLGIFIPMMDESMDAAGRSLGGSPAAIYKKGRQLWRSNRELYGAQVIADIIKQRPNNSKMIFSILKEGDPEQVGLVLKAVNDPKAIDKIKSGFLTGMIKESSEVTARKTAGRELVGEKLLDAWTQIPEGVRKQIYGAKADEIQNAFRILSLSEESIKSGGLVGIRAAQALGVAGLIALPIAAATGEEAEFGGRGTALSATTGVLLIGPELLASLVLKRPGFAKLLGQGFKFNRVNRQSTAALTRLGRMVLLERKSLNKKRKSIIRKQVNEVRKAKVRKELSKQAILKIR